MNDDDTTRLLAKAEEILRAEDERVDAEEDRELDRLCAEVQAQVSGLLDRARQVKRLNRSNRLGRQASERLEWLYDELEQIAHQFGGEVPPDARRPTEGAR